jgi:hypothetical protein
LVLLHEKWNRYILKDRYILVLILQNVPILQNVLFDWLVHFGKSVHFGTNLRKGLNCCFFLRLTMCDDKNSDKPVCTYDKDAPLS